MKKILFVGVTENGDFYELHFEINWFEYFILKNIFKKKKFSCSKVKIRGSKYNLVVTDEVVK